MTLACPQWRTICSGVIAIALASSLGCVEDAPPAQAPERPAPLPEFVSAPPVPGMLWVAGCWHWDGSAYVWLPGHWESPPPQ